MIRDQSKTAHGSRITVHARLVMNLSGIRENTTLAMETLVAHKFRAALTILGVFIGVLVIVAMAAVLNGFRQSVLDNAESFGTRNVTCGATRLS